MQAVTLGQDVAIFDLEICKGQLFVIVFFRFRQQYIGRCVGLTYRCHLQAPIAVGIVSMEASGQVGQRNALGDNVAAVLQDTVKPYTDLQIGLVCSGVLILHRNGNFHFFATQLHIRIVGSQVCKSGIFNGTAGNAQHNICGAIHGQADSPPVCSTQVNTAGQPGCFHCGVGVFALEQDFIQIPFQYIGHKVCAIALGQNITVGEVKVRKGQLFVIVFLGFRQ